MKMSSRSLSILFSLALLLFGFSSCVDKEFDEPPANASEDPEISVPVVSVADILAKWSPGNIVELTDDVAMKAVVIANDESGNVYKSLIVSDEDGSRGITIIIDQVEMFNTYSVGRRVYVLTKGLYIGDYNGLPQLGTTPSGGDLGRIPEALTATTVLPGVRGINVAPKEKTINSLGNTDMNTLVKLSNIEFGTQAVNNTYADAVNQSAVSRTLQDCNGNDIIMRTSGYATFAGETVPSGNGSLVCVFTKYFDTNQLVLRDLDDVDMTGARCDGGTTGGGDGDQISVKSLRDEYENGTETAPEGYIVGVVISDRSTGNFNGQNLFVQDGEYGIAVRFTDTHSFNLGDQIKMYVSGVELSAFKGLVQLNNASLSSAQVSGSSTLPSPKEVTLSEFLSNNFDLQSTRVLIKNAEISGDENYGFNTVTDATGTAELYTSSFASFSTQNHPVGNVNITAIASIYDDAQLLINSPQDVVGGTTGGGGDNCDNTTGEMSIEVLHCKFADGDATIGDNYINAVVISDVNSGNINNKNLHVQSGGYGIALRLDEAHTFALGQEIKVNLNGRQLTEYNGLLQIEGIPNTDVELIGTGTLPTPRVATIAEILANNNTWESTLVKVENATLSGGTTFSGELTVSDGTGTIALYTRSSATVADDNVPSGSINLVAIVGEFNKPQLLLRNGDDIQ